MLVNIFLLISGIWGIWYCLKYRSRAGIDTFFDYASPTTHPTAHVFVIGLRLLIFGLCAAVGSYRLLFGIVN